jgi:superfamily II DNA or RNA helicase
MRLEELQPNAAVRGILPDCLVTVIATQWYGSEALDLTYKDPTGRLGNTLLYRHDEPRLDLVEQGRTWSFDGDGSLFRLVSEAHRIRLAHLFDPVLAVHTSQVDPLPHQITAVYDSMLPRQPLRFLLADDPGAGKTIMAGLLMKELIVRGDLQRCLVVCPGSLAEQWQDELYQRFQLPFEILTNDKLEAARTGNWFVENNLVIARLDKLSRDENVQEKLKAPDCRWDLIVCDEAHKLSATFFGGEVKYTKRHRLGQLLSTLTRHFLLMTATPHNGKEADFQLFMALLDGDRFEGRFRDGAHAADVSDLMRRMVKENLLKFDGTHLFPERIAYTVSYKLSDAEARLYKEVTDYVREEFNRAEALQNDKRVGTVGFALTILQRRLASSPEAIYQSLRRRRERLEKKLRELEFLQRGAVAAAIVADVPVLDEEDVDDLEDDASLTRTGDRRVISRRMLYVELDAAGNARHLQYAPYLDCRPLKPEDPSTDAIFKRAECSGITKELELKAQTHAITHVVPEHLQEVRDRRVDWINKTRAAVNDRLIKEINFGDHRAETLKLQEQSGKVNARLNSQEARRRADELQSRLQKRME